jgi:predicted branched-subunit amino acid permease
MADGVAAEAAPGAPAGEALLSPPEARRKLVLDGLGIIVSAFGFGFVYSLAATDAGFSVIDIMAMSVFAFAGAAQFAAVGYVAGGLPWLVIGVLTGLLNARHVLYSAAIAPWFRGRSFRERAFAAHFLTDEAFALSMAHFRRLGRYDAFGYWYAAIVVDFIPWFLATLSGALIGKAIVDPERLGIDVIFPAAMIGLAVGLITGRRELVAALVGGAVGVGVSLASTPTVGIIAGGVIGPAVGLLVPASQARERAPIGTEASADRYSMPHTLVDRPREDELR